MKIAMAFIEASESFPVRDTSRVPLPKARGCAASLFPKFKVEVAMPPGSGAIRSDAHTV